MFGLDKEVLRGLAEEDCKNMITARRNALRPISSELVYGRIGDVNDKFNKLFVFCNTKKTEEEQKEERRKQNEQRDRETEEKEREEAEREGAEKAAGLLLGPHDFYSEDSFAIFGLGREELRDLTEDKCEEAVIGQHSILNAHSQRFWEGGYEEVLDGARVELAAFCKKSPHEKNAQIATYKEAEEKRRVQEAQKAAEEAEKKAKKAEEEAEKKAKKDEEEAEKKRVAADEKAAKKAEEAAAGEVSA